MIPIILHKSFHFQSFSGKQKGSFTKLFVSVLWDKNFRQNRDAPPLVCMKIFELKNFLKQKKFLQWNILAMWDKIFSRANRGNSPLPSIDFSSLPKSLWNTEWFPVEDFSVLWDRKTSKKPWIFTSPLLETFWHQKSFEKQKCSATIFIGTVGQKFSIEICDIPFLCLQFFDTRNFLKHRRVPRQNFSALWDESFSSKTRDTLLHKG